MPLYYSAVTRREFLKRSLAGAGAVAAFPTIIPSRVLGANAPSNRIAMASIGTGNQGTSDLKNFLRDERVQVVAICDVNRESPGYWDGAVAGWQPARKLVDDHYRSAKGC